MPWPPSARGRLARLARTCRRHAASVSGGMPGPSSVTRSVTDSGAHDGVDRDRRLRRRVRDGIADRRCRSLARPASRPLAPAADRPADRRRTSACAPRRRAALTIRSTISRKSIQSRRNSSAPASMRVMARRLRTISSSAFGLLLDLAEQILLRLGVELVAVIDQAGRRTEDGGERRAEIVRDRREQRVAHALGLGRRRLRADHLARQRARVRARRPFGRRACSSSARASESSGVPSGPCASADHAERLVADAQRHEIPRDDRQCAGVRARWLACVKAQRAAVIAGSIESHPPAARRR